jgi:hypothetical protein
VVPEEAGSNPPDRPEHGPGHWRDQAAVNRPLRLCRFDSCPMHLPKAAPSKLLNPEHQALPVRGGTPKMPPRRCPPGRRSSPRRCGRRRWTGWPISSWTAHSSSPTGYGPNGRTFRASIGCMGMNVQVIAGPDGTILWRAGGGLGRPHALQGQEQARLAKNRQPLTRQAPRARRTRERAAQELATAPHAPFQPRQDRPPHQGHRRPAEP